MVRVGLVVHGHLGHARDYAASAVSLLQALDVEIFVEDSMVPMLPGTRPLIVASLPPDALLSLGGDGTILRGVQYAIAWGVPLLGVNLGRKGFLAEIEPDDLENALTRLVKGDYAIEERPLLSARINGEEWLALNDVVVSRGGYARLIGVTTRVDGESAARYLADGVIVATPTGSTGYSLSAGGPVVSPHVDCMVVTPICAHSLQHRPVVVSGDSLIRLELDTDEEQTACLQVDGQNRAVLTAGMSVEVGKAKEKVRLIRMTQERFFHLVRGKLAEWSK